MQLSCIIDVFFPGGVLCHLRYLFVRPILILKNSTKIHINNIFPINNKDAKNKFMESILFVTTHLYILQPRPIQLMYCTIFAHAQTEFVPSQRKPTYKEVRVELGTRTVAKGAPPRLKCHTHPCHPRLKRTKARAHWASRQAHQRTQSGRSSWPSCPPASPSPHGPPLPSTTSHPPL